MKILMISTTDILGGAAKVAWSLKNRLEHEGHSVTMFVADKRSNERNVKIIPRNKLLKLIGFLLATDNLIHTDWIMKTKEFQEADIIHCHNLHGRFFNLKTLIKMSRIKPIIWTLHDEWAITPHCACTLETNSMEYGLFVCPSKDTPPRILWNNTRHLAREKNNIYKESILNIVTPSKWLENRVRKTILSIQRINHIPNGINTKDFIKIDKKIAREKLGLPTNKKLVLFLAESATQNIWKGWSYTKNIIDKYRGNQDILFISVGNRVKLDNEENVVHLGYIDKREELSLYYSASDILIFTSIAENFPLVILEAMSCGLPILSFDVGGVREVLTHKENGYIAKYRDEIDLQSGFEWLLGLKDNEIQEIAIDSSNKIKGSYSEDIMFNKYLGLYTDIISHKSNG